MTNYEKYSTEDGIRDLIGMAISYSEDCSVCYRLGIVESPCTNPICSLASVKDGSFDRRMDEWLQQETE